MALGATFLPLKGASITETQTDTQPAIKLNKYTAILGVHLVGDIVSEGTAFGSLFYPEVARRNIIEQCNRAYAAVRKAGGTVVHLRVAFEPDYRNCSTIVPLLAMAKEAGALRDGDPGADLVPEVQVEEGDLIITHTMPGPFSSSDILERFDAIEVEQVIVCGVATNASVESAVREASDLQYEPIILEDACSAATPEAHAASIESMGLFGYIRTVDELVAAADAAAEAAE